ncbi:MAG: hypothetical protein R3C97_13390 [Geminicoccaceae bacterium]
MTRDALLAVTQATSPLFAREGLLVHRGNWQRRARRMFTVRRSKATTAYHAYVPSFPGEWGFVIAGARASPANLRPLPEELRYLEASMLPSMQHFSDDMAPVESRKTRSSITRW